MSNAILPARSCKHGKCLINLGNNFGSILLKVINNNIQIERSDIFVKSFSNNAFVSMISQLNEKKKYGCIESRNNRPINTCGRTVVVFEHLYTPKRLKNHNKALKNKDKQPNASEACTEMQYMAQGKAIGNNNEPMLKENTKNLFETRSIDYTDKKVMTRKLELVRTFSKQVHGKMSIIFKQSYKFKSDECSSTNQTVNFKNSINFNDSNIQATGSKVNLCNLVRDENVTNLENSTPSMLSEGNSIDKKENHFSIIKMAKVLNAKSQNAPTDYVGKVKILFNHSGRFKSSVLPSSERDSDLERQNKDKECTVCSKEHKSKNDLIFLEGSVPQKIIQYFKPLLKNMTYSQKPSSFDNSKPLESGKMKINFNHSTKTKSFNKVGNILAKNDASKQDNDNVYTLTNTEETNTELNSQPENKLTKNDTFIDAHDFSGCNIASNVNTMNSCTLQEQESTVAEIPESKRETFQVEKTCNFNAETTHAQNQDGCVDNITMHKINTNVHKVKYLPKKIKKSKLMSKSKRKLPPSATRIALEKSKQSLDRLIMFNSDPQCGFITGNPDKIKTVEDMVEGTKPRKVEERGLKEKVIVQKFDGNIEKMSETENKVISQGEENFDKKKIPLQKTEQNNLKAINKCHSENNLEFTNLLSDPHEIGIMTINSTRTAEPIESNDDANFYKRIFTDTNALKKLVKKKTPSYKMTENKSFPSVEVINKEDKHNEETLKNEKQLDTFQTDPLGCKPFLKSVSNLLEIIQINEFIDDIIKTPGRKMKPGVCTTQNKKNPGISKEKNKILVTNCKSAQLDVPTIPDNKRIFQLGPNKITITEISKTDAFPPPVVKVQNCDVGNNPSQTEQSTKKQVQAAEMEHPKGMKLSTLKESLPAQDSSKENDPNSSTISKIRKSATIKMINHFESFQGVIDFPQGTKIVKNVVKDRMQAYQDISKKFEKMGLYRKVPKKKLMEEIEDSRKNTLATIKRDLELQDKYKNTPKGKRMQDYFHSFKFRLTSTMKEYGKRKNLKNSKKMLISSKLGKLNPQTSPSKPSFARKGNRKNKYV
ncbi:uncharacterized protein LOC106661585 [Cimex lectularius]|uniref:Uncharacterized protein n=1 Tax=Cimex lectularius TaxID=79782 RepID=A0A8I6RB67_CIMLE|nr:uncharacterized protein LOC106661585 [Cimex lectularius]